MQFIKRLLSIDSDYSMVARPILYKDMILLDASNTLYAFDIESGEKIWITGVSVKDSYLPDDQLMVSDGVVYLCHNKFVNAVKIENGEFLWKIKLPDNGYIHNIIENVLLVSCRGILCAIDLNGNNQI